MDEGSQAVPPGMTGRLSMGIGHFVRQLRRNPIAATTWPSALRRGLLVGLITVVATATGELTAGFAVAIGALNLGLVDGVVPKRSLATVLALVTVGTGVVCFVSVLVAGSWWSLLLLVVLAYVYGCLAGSGFIAMHAALVTLITGVVFSNAPGDLHQATLAALFAVAGCLLQMASSLLAWRFERKAAMRRSLGQLLLTIADLIADGDPTSEAAFRAANQGVSAQRTLAGARFDEPTREYFARVLREALAARLAVSSWLSTTGASPDQRAELAENLRSLDARLRHTGRHRGSSAPLDRGNSETLSNAVGAHMTSLLAALDHPISEVGDSGSHSVADRASSGLDVADRVLPWLRLLTPSGQMARHGFRLALAIGIAQTLTLLFHLDRGYWLSVTVLIALQPDFAATLTHGAQRALGTFVGVLTVGLIVAATGGSPWVLVAIVVVMAVLVMKYQTANYGVEAFFITCFVASLLESVDPTDTTLALRLVNTLVGFVIALVVYLALPSWKSDGVKDLLLDAVTTHKAWIDRVLVGLIDPARTDSVALRELGDQARSATLRARPDADAAMLEPRNLDKDPRAAVDALAALQAMGVSALAIETTIREAPSSLHPAAVDPVRSAVDSVFDKAVDALDGSSVADSAGAHDAVHIPDTGDEACNRALALLLSTSTTLELAVARVQ